MPSHRAEHALICVYAHVWRTMEIEAAQMRSERRTSRAWSRAFAPGSPRSSGATCQQTAPPEAGSGAKSIFGRQSGIFAATGPKSDQGGEFRDLGQTDDEFGHLGQQSATASAAESASTNAPRLGTAPATYIEGATTCCPYLAPRDPRQARVGLDPFPCLICEWPVLFRYTVSHTFRSVHLNEYGWDSIKFTVRASSRFLSGLITLLKSMFSF